MAGLLAQGACNNAVAEPAILGTAAGASFGAVLAISTGLVEVGTIGAIACGTIGALLTTALTFKLAAIRGALSSFTLIIVGIAISAIFTSFVGIASAMASRADARSISFWSFGSLALVTPKSLAVLLPVMCIGAVMAWKIAPTVDLLSLGDDSVRHIGFDPQKIRLRSFALLAILIAATVSSVGSIAFLALAAPHIARYLLGPQNRKLVFYSAAIGALILLVADTASRALVPPNELPIGLLTSLLGAPILILTLKRGGDIWR